MDVNGNVFAKLPRVCAKPPADPHVDPQTGAQACGLFDDKFLPDLPNGPFDAGQFVPLDEMTRSDLVHRFYQEQMQIDGGKMDKFAALSNSGGLTMGYFDGSKTAMWKLAREYTLADNFFHGVFGGSFLNHIWLACACAPVFPDAPPTMVAQLDQNGSLVKDGTITPEGGTVPKDRAVNTIMPTAMPHPKIDPAKPGDPPLPPQFMTTIGDELTDQAHVDWAWYSGGFADAMAGFNLQNFQYHHQPYVYFDRYKENSDERKKHLKDGAEFERDIDAGRLPAVSFYKPVGELNQHPNYASIEAGDRKAAELIHKIQSNKKLWGNSVIIVTYDENGGQWDHVAPPKIDPWGPGTRISGDHHLPFRQAALCRSHAIRHDIDPEADRSPL